MSQEWTSMSEWPSDQENKNILWITKVRAPMRQRQHSFVCYINDLEELSQITAAAIPSNKEALLLEIFKPTLNKCNKFQPDCLKEICI